MALTLVAILIPFAFAIDFIGEFTFVGLGGGNVTIQDFSASRVFLMGVMTGFDSFTFNAVNIGTVGFDCEVGDAMNITIAELASLNYTISGAGNQTIYYRGLGMPDFIVGGTVVVGVNNTLTVTTLGAGFVALDWIDLDLVSLTASDSRIGVNVTITIDANITYVNGTAWTTPPVFIEGVNSTHQGAGIWRINQTQATPGVYNYTDVQTSAENLTGSLTVIWDYYNIDVSALFTQLEAGFRSLIYANGSSVVDGHTLANGDTLVINGVTLGWNVYMGRFESTVTSGVAAIVTYDTLTTLLEATYGVATGNITSAPTITWTTPRIERVTLFMRQGDWPGAIIEINVLLMGATMFWTFLLMAISVGVYNYAGAEVTLMVWMLGWGTFSTVIHSQAQTIALIMMAVGGGIYIAKFFLDRRTSV